MSFWLRVLTRIMRGVGGLLTGLSIVGLFRGPVFYPLMVLILAFVIASMGLWLPAYRKATQPEPREA